MSRKSKKANGVPRVKNEGKRIHIIKAVFGLILGAIFYVGIPYAMINYVIPEHLIENAIPGLVIDWTNITPLFERWLYAGIPMAVISFFVWIFPKGSRARFFSSSIYLLASIGWLVYVMNFGNLDNLAVITYNGTTYAFGIILTGFMYLLIFFKCLKLLTVYAVYKDNRSEYLSRFPQVVNEV